MRVSDKFTHGALDIIQGFAALLKDDVYVVSSMVAIGLEIAVLYALTAGWKDAKGDLRL